MWKRNLKTFTKHLINNKIYTLVTVFGFAISLTFVILLSVYIKNELAVNTNHAKKDRIFRLVNEKYAGFAPPVGEWLQSEIPEIESYTRIYKNDGIVKNTDGAMLKMDYLMADSTFFNIFTFNLLGGNKQAALKTKNSVVLSNSFAKKLFGNTSPLGKQIVIGQSVNCIVTGVVEDISKKSNFIKCDAIVNFRCLADIWDWQELLTSYGNCSFGLYFLAKPNTNLQSKAPQVLKMFKKDFWMYQDGRFKVAKFELLTDSYFSTIRGSGVNTNNKILVSIFSAIVLLILVLAIINYINLTIAQSGLRVKETAIKKLVGSSRKKLIVQYITESVVLCYAAFALALLFSFLIEPVFNNLLQTELNLSAKITGNLFVLSIVAVTAIGLLSGIIPALVITKLNAVDVIKGNFRRKSKAVYSRVLIGFQYVIVIALLISTIIILRQTNYMMNINLGFNSSNIVSFENNLDGKENQAFKSKLLSIAGVKNVSFVKGSPIDGGNNQSFNYNNKPVSFQSFVVDSSFFPMMQIKTTPTGVAYSKKGVWINKKAIKTLELDTLPKKFKFSGTDVPVLGVVNDFNYGSVHENIGPVIIQQLKNDGYAWSFLVHIEANNTVSILENIKTAYSEFTGGLPFDYEFMDDTIQSWYEQEQKTTQIMSAFTTLAIIISVMGIFAMSLFYVQQKTKEIGVRKVNGATISEIMQMLNRDFVKWVVVAFVLAAPIAYYAMNKWLQNFAYKTTLSWWVFALAGSITLIIALLTVSWQTFKAARRNPVEALRYE